MRTIGQQTTDAHAGPPASTTPPDALVETLGCALLWLDVASFALERQEPREAGRSIINARMQLRGAIRRLAHPAGRSPR